MSNADYRLLVITTFGDSVSTVVMDFDMEHNAEKAVEALTGGKNDYRTPAVTVRRAYVPRAKADARVQLNEEVQLTN